MHDELIPHQKVSAIVDNVHLALRDIDAAFALLAGAKARLTATLGHEHSYYDSLWQNRIYDGNFERTSQESQAHVTRNAWRYVVAQIGINAYMTEKRQAELKKQIEEGNLPDLTAENILGTLQSLAERTPELLEESISLGWEDMTEEEREHPAVEAITITVPRTKHAKE